MIELFNEHRKAIVFVAVMALVFGVVAMLRMPVSLFPDITFPRIVILVDNGEEPAERMMVEVTRPLEEAVNSIPGVTLVQSTTSRGSAEISVRLDWKTDVQQALQMIQGHIANIRNELPQTASIQAERMTVSVFPIQGYTLTSDSLSQAALRDIALYRIRPVLMRVGGIARVEVTGGDTREFEVVLSPEKLQSYGLTAPQVSDAIKNTNLIDATGLINSNYRLYLSLVSGQMATVGDIESAVVAVRSGVPVRVVDVAQVKMGVAENYIRTTAHSHPAVLITIIKQPTGSTVRIGKEVAAALVSIPLPPGIHFENDYNQSSFIDSSIHNTRDSIVVGIILAMGVLFLFLGSWKIMAVIAVIVPTTIATAIVCLQLAGQTINIMTLGGIAAAIGLIIDDTIVIIESIFSQFTKGQLIPGSRQPFLIAAGRSIKELLPAVIGSTASTIVILVPLIFLSDITGAFFSALSLTMIFALLISFLLSLSLAPLLATFVLRADDIQREVGRENKGSRFFSWYERTLRKLLKRSYLIVPAAIGILLLVVFFYSRIGTGFMPEMDEGAFVLDYTAPPGTSLDETDRMLQQVEKILMATPEVEAYSRRTGTQLGFFLTEPNTGDFTVKLKKNRSRDINEIIADVREKIESSLPALQVDFGQLIMDVIGDLVNGPSPIEIKLFADNTALLHKTARQAAGLIETVPGVVDVFNGITISGPSFIMHIDPQRAAKAGFDAATVQGDLETIMRGRAETSIQKGEKLIAIRVRYPDAFRHDFDRIEEIKLVNANGVAVPLANFATFERTRGQAELDREGLRQMVAVKARISGRDLGHTIADIKKKLDASLVLPTGITYTYGGVYKTQQESFRSLLFAALSAALLVFLVLLIEFKEFRVPLSILIIDVLSLLGVFFALWITNVSFNISSFVGVILVIGIVAENAIFLMHSTKSFQGKGMALEEALIKACRVRTRPILMTTIGAVLAFLPLALGIGTGAQMQQPLAIAVIGGFSVSSLLLFFGLPLVYNLLKR